MGSQPLCLTYGLSNKSQPVLNNTLVMSCSVHCVFSVNINNIFTDFFRMPVFKWCNIYYFPTKQNIIIDYIKLFVVWGKGPH